MTFKPLRFSEQFVFKKKGLIFRSF